MRLRPHVPDSLGLRPHGRCTSQCAGGVEKLIFPREAAWQGSCISNDDVCTHRDSHSLFSLSISVFLQTPHANPLVVVVAVD